MKILKKLPIFLFAVFTFTCGIEEYYYLPQVSQGNIIRIQNTEARIEIPALDPVQFYYARYYLIYYRIYISGELISGEIQTSTSEIMNRINPSLANDFNALYGSTDPASTSMPSSSLFSNRKYFELSFKAGNTEAKNILTSEGGTLRIYFPPIQWDYPIAVFNRQEYRLHRSVEPELRNFEPSDDPYFRNTSDLNNNDYATSEKNADVTGRTGITQRYAYVSMYIVAAGQNPVGFTPIYSKPTHIGIFKLTDTE